MEPKPANDQWKEPRLCATDSGCPEVNGKVERIPKTDTEEFYRGRHFRYKKDLARKLKRWEAEYNEDRPHLALKGKTPAERVRELVHPSKTAKDVS
jgi:transposase InsO family protein